MSIESYEIRKLTPFDNVVGQYGFFGRRLDRGCLGRYVHGWSLAQGYRRDWSLL
jgi:hypothetical protein